MSTNRQSVESFLFRSFRLLDERQYQEWLDLFTPDCSYIVNTVESVARGDRLTLVNDDHDRMKVRLQQITDAWACEHPPTHTLHMVSNVEVEEGAGGEATVYSCFVVYATRRGKQGRFAGRYRDTLRTVDGSWKIARRIATLEKDLVDEGKISFFI